MKRFVRGCLGSAVLALGVTITPLASTADVPAHAATEAGVVVAVEGSNGALWVQDPVGTGWQSLGGKIIAPPAVAYVPAPGSTTASVPLFIAIGTDGQLYARTLTTGWQAITSDTCYSGGPAAFYGQSLFVACSIVYHQLWWENTLIFSSDGLPQFQGIGTTVGGVLTATPAIASVGYTVTYFVTGTDGAVYTSAGAGFSATPWRCIGAPAAAGFMVSDTDSYFACEGTNHALWAATYTGTGWSEAASLGGDLIAAPAVALTSSGPEYFAVGTNHAIWMRSASSGWSSLGGYAVGGVGAAALN